MTTGDTMTWETELLPENGTWCWVTDGKSEWIAIRDLSASGGWSNKDTWEDFDQSVIAWTPIPKPERFTKKV